MELSPEWLGVREEGVEPRDHRGTPEVSGCPAIGLELSGSPQRERGGLEEGEHARHEETAVRNDL